MRPSTRFEVFKRDRFTCVYCGRSSPSIVLEIDHVLAVSRGGTDEIDNLVTSCSDCNRGKSDRALEQVAPALDMAARAARIAEHEAQITEYAKWKAAQREREDRDIQALGAVFTKIPGTTFRRDGSERWFWQDTSVRKFVRKLGYHGVLDALDLVASRAWAWGRARGDDDLAAEEAWRYFCGCCWGKIRDLDP